MAESARWTSITQESPELVSAAGAPSALARDSVNVFSPRVEFINTYLGIFCLFVIGAFSFAIPSNEIQSLYNPAMLFIFNILFLNLTHNAFSLVLPLVTPEVRTWWKESRFFNLTTNQFVLLIFGSIFLCSSALFMSMSFTPYRLEAVAIFGIIALIWDARHSLGQSYGISRLYDDRKQQAHGQMSAKENRLIHWQKILIWSLLAVSIVKFSLLVLFKRESAFPTLISGLSFLAAAVVTLLVLLAAIETHGTKSNKAMYLMRLYVYAINSPDFPLAPFGTFVLHSFESAAITFMMIKNSYSKEKASLSVVVEKPIDEVSVKVRRYWAGAIGCILLIIFLAQFREFLFAPMLRKNFRDYVVLLNFLAAASFSFSLTHFALDELMFRMRDASARKHILPLLRKN